MQISKLCFYYMSYFCSLLSIRSINSFTFIRVASATNSNLIKQIISTTSSKNNIKLYDSSSSSPSNINGDNNQNNNSENNSKNIRPKTGWNHNLPNELSDFWKGQKSKEEETYESQKQQQQEQSSSNLKTGWLHNKQPVSEQKPVKSLLSSSTTASSSLSSPIARLRLEQAMKQQQNNHRIIKPPTFHSSSLGIYGIVTTEHLLSVPLYRNLENDNNVVNNNNNNNNARIDIYFTIVEIIDTDEYKKFLETLVTINNPQQRAKQYVNNAALKNADTMILYLQGGPGFGAPSPVSGLSFSSSTSSWAAKALDSTSYKRIVLMDQRGTGKSSPVTKQTLEIQYPNLFILDNTNDHSKTLDELELTNPEQVKIVKDTVQDVTNYLIQFRADNIVYDAEDIRKSLLILPNLDTPEGVEEVSSNKKEEPKPWGCSLGQSYGGFCSMTYLSKINYPPKVMLLTGGIAPMLAKDITSVYTGFWERVRQRNYLYYDMYPGDIKDVHQIIQKLINFNIKLPSGGQLTARRFLQIGLMLGSSPSSFASLHNIIGRAFIQLPNQLPVSEASIDDLQFSRSFLKEIDSISSFDDAPFYFWMHESIYADGTGISNPTMWAAHNAYEEKCIENSDFDYKVTSASNNNDQKQIKPTLFFGEMVFPWMSDDYAELSGIGLKAVANALAEKSDWSNLYNSEKMKENLESGRTKIAAAVYYDDMYVDFNECMKVVAPGAPLEKCKVYITNEYQHSGLRDDGPNIFTKLYGMALGSTRTPS